MPNDVTDNLNSVEAEDAMRKRPSWFIRNGTLFMFAVAGIFLAAASVTTFTETVTCPAVITLYHPPAVIVTKVSGRVFQWMARDGDNVQRGETVAVIENPASFDDVESVKTFIRQVGDSLESGQVMTKIPARDLHLPADLQYEYALYIYFLRGYAQCIKKNRSVNGIITYLRNSFPDSNKNLYIAERNNLLWSVRATGLKLTQMISDWEGKFLLMSPDSGQILYIKKPLPSAYVSVGEPLCIIRTFNETIAANITLPARLSGRIRTGQQVKLGIKRTHSDHQLVIDAAVAGIDILPQHGDSVRIRLQLPNPDRLLLQQIAVNGKADAMAMIMLSDKTVLKKIMESIKPQ